MMTKIAQINLYDGNGFVGFGPLGLEQNQDGVSTFARVISSAIGLITIIGIIWVVIIIVTGAIGIITSGGDKNSLENAKKKISNGIIGLVILVSSLFILTLIGKFLGLTSILDIKTLFELLAI